MQEKQRKTARGSLGAMETWEEDNVLSSIGRETVRESHKEQFLAHLVILNKAIVFLDDRGVPCSSHSRFPTGALAMVVCLL